MKSVFLILILFVVAGCQSAGTGVGLSSSQDQVWYDADGNPHHLTVNSNGTREWNKK